MITDENIIELFFARSEQGIRELDTKYGKDCHNLSYHIVGSRQDACSATRFLRNSDRIIEKK